MPAPLLNATQTSLHWGLPLPNSRAVVPLAAAEALASWAASAEPLLTVRAPRGWGKSTTVAAWLRRSARDRAVVWIAASHMFHRWDDVRFALEEGMRDLGLLDGDGPGEVATARLYVALQRLREPLYLVLDDSDELRPIGGLARFRREVARFPMLKTIVIGLPRIDGFTAVAPTIGRRELAWRARDARSAIGEAATIAAPRLRMDDIVRISGGYPPAILDYFAEERRERAVASPESWRATWILQKTGWAPDPDAARTAILGLAKFLHLPESWTPLLGAPNVGAALRWLIDEGLVERVSSDGSTPAVRLAREDRKALAAVFRDTESAALHLSAATGFAAAGFRAGAIHHLIHAGRPDRAISALKDPLGTSELQAGLEDLRDAVAEIPAQLLAGDLLAHALAVLLAHTPPVLEKEARTQLESQLLSASPDRVAALPLASRVVVTTAILRALTARGRVREAARAGRPLARELLGLSRGERAQLGVRASYLWLAHAEAELLDGFVDSAGQYASAGLAEAEETGESAAVIQAEIVSAACAALVGDIEYARGLIPRAEARVKSEGWGSSPRIKLLDFARMLIAGADSDRETMELVAQRFGDERERNDHWWTMGAVARARLHLLRGEAIQALAEARTVARFATTAVLPSMLRAAIAGVNADALITLGRPGPAVRVLDEIEETPEHAFCQGPRRASAALLLGDSRGALAATDECLTLGGRHVARMLPRVLLLRAVAQDRLGMRRAADASFVDALAHLLSRAGGFELFEFLSDSLQPLWERVDRSDPLLSTATAHLRQQRPTPLPQRPTTQPIPVALSAREIEVISMLRTDATVAEIGQRLYLSSNTIKSHVRSLYKKLGASNRREALDAADTLGIGQTG